MLMKLSAFISFQVYQFKTSTKWDKITDILQVHFSFYLTCITWANRKNHASLLSFYTAFKDYMLTDLHRKAEWHNFLSNIENDQDSMYFPAMGSERLQIKPWSNNWCSSTLHLILWKDLFSPAQQIVKAGKIRDVWVEWRDAFKFAQRSWVHKHTFLRAYSWPHGANNSLYTHIHLFVSRTR